MPRLLAPFAKYAPEVRTLLFDFSYKLGQGDVLVAGPATVAVDDPALSATNATVIDDVTVAVRVAGGLVGAAYRVRVVVATTAGNTLELDRVVEILP